MSRSQVIWLVARREVLERICSRSFLLFTLALVLAAPATIIAIDRLPNLLDPGPDHIGVVEEQGFDLDQAVETSARELDVEIEVELYLTREAGERALTSGDIDALVVGTDTLIFEEEADDEISAVVNSAVIWRRYHGGSQS